MRGDVTVYSPKNVLCTMGIHIASGFTEDGFITITPQGDGVTDESKRSFRFRMILAMKSSWFCSTVPKQSTGC